MNIFEHFPNDEKCPICRKNDDKQCVLVPITGTQEGNIVQATPTHLECILDNLMHFDGFMACPAEPPIIKQEQSDD